LGEINLSDKLMSSQKRFYNDKEKTEAQNIKAFLDNVKPYANMSLQQRKDAGIVGPKGGVSGGTATQLWQEYHREHFNTLSEQTRDIIQKTGQVTPRSTYKQQIIDAHEYVSNQLDMYPTLAGRTTAQLGAIYGEYVKKMKEIYNTANVDPGVYNLEEIKNLYAQKLSQPALRLYDEYKDKLTTEPVPKKADVQKYSKVIDKSGRLVYIVLKPSANLLTSELKQLGISIKEGDFEEVGLLNRRLDRYQKWLDAQTEPEHELQGVDIAKKILETGRFPKELPAPLYTPGYAPPSNPLPRELSGAINRPFVEPTTPVTTPVNIDAIFGAAPTVRQPSPKVLFPSPTRVTRTPPTSSSVMSPNVKRRTITETKRFYFYWPDPLTASNEQKYFDVIFGA